MPVISGNVPDFLEIGAKTGFLTGYKRQDLPWRRLAAEVTMTAASHKLTDIGAAPMPLEDVGQQRVRDYVERAMTLNARNWSTTIGVSYNALKDDQTGALSRLNGDAAQIGFNFQKHLNKLTFQQIENGDGAANLGYDGVSFFDAAHVDAGAEYATAQDNEYGLALSLDNFSTVYQAAQVFRDDRGEFTEFMYDLLVVPPALEYTAAQITGNREAYDTGNREVNAYAGKLTYVVSPHLASTAWALIASSENSKPIIVGMREAPGLQSSWFDPNGPDGGMYYFKYYARYCVSYGDWRLAALGNT